MAMIWVTVMVMVTGDEGVRTWRWRGGSGMVCDRKKTDLDVMC